MTFIRNLQEKSIETKKRILWGGVIIVAIILFSFLIWQQKKQLSSLNLSSKDIPKLELPTEELERLKSAIRELEELKKQKLTIPGLKKDSLEKLRNFNLKEEDLDKLSEEDKKKLEDFIKEIQESLKGRVAP